MNRDIAGIEIVPAFGTSPRQLAMYLASGQRLTSIEFAEAVSREHYHVMRDIRSILGRLDDTNREFLALDEGVYIDERGREQPLYIFGQEAIEFFMAHVDVNYRCSLLRELYAYREAFALVLRQQRDLSEGHVMRINTFDKRSPYFGRTDVRALQRAIESRLD